MCVAAVPALPAEKKKKKKMQQTKFCRMNETLNK
jgi:hypothetical protein